MRSLPDFYSKYGQQKQHACSLFHFAALILITFPPNQAYRTRFVPFLSFFFPFPKMSAKDYTFLTAAKIKSDLLE